MKDTAKSAHLEIITEDADGNELRRVFDLVGLPHSEGTFDVRWHDKPEPDLSVGLIRHVRTGEVDLAVTFTNWQLVDVKTPA